MPCHMRMSKKSQCNSYHTVRHGISNTIRLTLTHICCLRETRYYKVASKSLLACCVAASSWWRDRNEQWYNSLSAYKPNKCELYFCSKLLLFNPTIFAVCWLHVRQFCNASHSTVLLECSWLQSKQLKGKCRPACLSGILNFTFCVQIGRASCRERV